MLKILCPGLSLGLRLSLKWLSSADFLGRFTDMSCRSHLAKDNIKILAVKKRAAHELSLQSLLYDPHTIIALLEFHFSYLH